MDNTNTLQPKLKKFFDDYYGWILLIVGVAIFILITKGEFFTDIIKGWNDGVRENNKTNFDAIGAEPSPIKDFIELFFGLLVILFFFGVLVTLLGNFFYHLFFKYILQKTNTIYVIAFIVWLLVFYDLFWEGLHLIFEKNNAFEMRYFYDGKEDFAVYKRKIIKEYRENYVTVVTSLSFLFIIAYGLIKNYIQTTKTQAKLIAQKSQAELAALKAQINPHFLFNVLNNLYGTAIVEESPKTSEGILQLSSIMRHVVEGTKNEKIELEKEIRFLNDYIDLSKIRIPNRHNIRIETKIDTDETPTMIAPLLVIPYLENAFKYGISMNEECFIEMSYVVKNQQLEFVCRNSIIKTNDKLEVGTGTGLENTQKRLNLYYPANYQLNTSSANGVFTVELTVNL